MSRQKRLLREHKILKNARTLWWDNIECNLKCLHVMLEDILKIGLDAFKNAFKKKYLKLVEQQEWGQCSGQENSVSKGPLKENQGWKMKVTSLWLPFCYGTPLSHQFHINCYHEKLPTIIFYPLIFLFIQSFIHSTYSEHLLSRYYINYWGVQWQ